MRSIKRPASHEVLQEIGNSQKGRIRPAPTVDQLEASGCDGMVVWQADGMATCARMSQLTGCCQKSLEYPEATPERIGAACACFVVAASAVGEGEPVRSWP